MGWACTKEPVKLACCAMCMVVRTDEFQWLFLQHAINADEGQKFPICGLTVVLDGQGYKESPSKIFKAHFDSFNKAG